MRNLKKKAFTLVELLVVIAIIAILAVAGVVGYVVFTKKAQQSNDTSLVSQLNEYMAAAGSTDSINTVSDARNLLIEDGIDLASLKLTAKGYRAAFDIANKKFVKVNKNNPEDYSGKAEDLFVFVSNEADATSFTNAGYSVYLQSGFNASTVNVKSGVDVGENSNITEVNYTSTDTKEVVIRTNSMATTLTINGNQSTINHYGSANVVNITAVAMSSYHENGAVSTLKVKAGRIVVAEDAYVGRLGVASDATSGTVRIENAGIIFAAEEITYTEEAYTTTGSTSNTIVNAVDTTDAGDKILIGSADAFINLAAAHAQGILTGSLDIELTANINISNKPWIPIGTAGNPFYGKFDGKNYTITGLTNSGLTDTSVLVNFVTANANSAGYAYGLFGVIGSQTGSESVEIKNVQLDQVAIDNAGSNMCGALVGADVAASKNTSGTINSAYAGTILISNVTVSGFVKANDSVSGVVGKLYSKGDTTITNCTNNADITILNSNQKKGAGILGFKSASTGSLTLTNNTNNGKITYVSHTETLDNIAGIAVIMKNGTNTITNNTNNGEVEVIDRGASVVYVMGVDGSTMNLTISGNTNSYSGYAFIYKFDRNDTTGNVYPSV